jgi:PAS domain S-box-containing protein
MVTERYLRRLKGDTIPNLYSCRIVDREGNTRWIEINSVLITWMGRPATLAFFSNVTERRNALERLRLLESAILHTNDSIVITTANPDQGASRIEYVNPAFTKMTGYTADEVIGKPSLILQGPKKDNTEWLRLEGTQSPGKAFYVETVNYRKDGSMFNLEWQIAPIRNERGKVTHFISTQRDITERKRAEEKVKTYQEQLQSLASELSLAEERERRRIATDLHDHIGQTLAITKMKLGALRESLSSDGEKGNTKLLSEIWGLVEQTIKYTKSLTFELSPPILYELGFEATIEWLGEQMQKQHGILFRVESDGTPKPLEKDVSVLMFQAVRELFMNTVKHAGATKARAWITRSNGTLQILVEDDGVGFDLSKIEKNTFGFFSIRERLKHFGGTFIIDTRPGEGTRVVLTAPIKTDGEVQ